MLVSVKLKTDLLKQIGAANASDFPVKLEAFIKEKEDTEKAWQEAEEKLSTMSATTDSKTSLDDLLNRFEALDKKIDDHKLSVEQRLAGIEEAAKIAARSEASRTVGEAVARTGSQVAAAANPNEGTHEKPRLAEDDFAGRWTAMSDDAKAEFGGNQKIFEAYEKARLGNRFKLFQKK